MLVDLPSGWRYGFPKHLPKDVKDIQKWAVEQGYPEELIKSLGSYFWVRYIAEDEDDVKRVSEGN